jgi:hypothetical protein
MVVLLPDAFASRRRFIFSRQRCALASLAAIFDRS